MTEIRRSGAETLDSAALSDLGSRLLRQPARVVFWEGPPAQAIYLGRGLSLDVHRHHATQITISLGEPVSVLTDHNGSVSRQQSFVVGPNVAHGIEAEETPIIEIFSEALALADLAQRLRMAAESETPPLPSDLLDGLWPHLVLVGDRMLNGETEEALVSDLVSRLLVSGFDDVGEPRVAAARSLVTPEFLLAEDQPIQALASHVHLSTSRFRHLWREEMGVSIQSYLRWQRLLTAMQDTAGGASLTEAAHGAGFADSAHLTRVFRATFGIAPSRIFKNSHSVQVITADTK